jgi:CubicO group peptidase (beta-lactamase class C family)
MRRLRRPGLKAALMAILCTTGCAAGPTDDALQTLVAHRTAWWRDRDHALDIADMGPLETVRGAPGEPLQAARPGAGSIRPAALDAAIAYVAPLHTQSLLVWQGGALQLEWYGAGYDRTSTSSPASMMKPVLALAIGAAVAGGRIRSVDDPVSAYLTEWAGEPRGAITVRQLLQMTSGLLKDGPATTDPRGAELMLGVRMEEVLLQTPLVRPPGEVFEYNNTNSALLGLILQRATGRRYADWLSHAVWRPIGASDAAVWLDRPEGLARTACCLVATGRDWLRLGLLIKDHGKVGGRQVIDGGWIDAMTAPSPINANFGYQIWRASPYAPMRGYGGGGSAVPASEPFVADDMVYFDGAIGQRVYISPRRDLVIVRIGRAAPSWDDAALPNIIVRGLVR